MKAKFHARMLVGFTGCLLLLASCSALIGPRDVPVPLSKLQETLDKRFPVEKRFLELINIKLSDPHLTLLPERQRVQLSLDVGIKQALSEKLLRARLTVSGGLRIDGARQAVVLSEPKVEGLELPGRDPADTQRYAKLGSFVLEKVIQEAPLLRLKEEDLTKAGVRFVPTSITVRKESVVVTVEPAGK